MFTFETLAFYQKAKKINSDLYRFLKSRPGLDRACKDQLRRASLSVMLNIAEGSGRFSKKDKRNFYIMARSSAFECISLLDFLCDEGELEKMEYSDYYFRFEELSKILYRIIVKLDSKSLK